ncbi:MAG: radical SAM protein [bacterium]
MKSKLKSPESVYGLNFTKGEIEEAKEKGHLLSLDMELSNVCNLRCKYCYNTSGERLKNELQLAEVIDIINQAKDLGVRSIIIIGGGEPILFNGLLEILTYLNKKGILSVLFTNGTMITREIAEKLFENNVSVVMKLNSMNSKIQDFLAGKKGAYEMMMQGLQNLIKAGFPSRECRFGIETVICKQNIEEIPKMWVWSRENGYIPYFETITYQGRAQKYNLNVSSQEIKELFYKLLSIDERKFGLTWEPKPPIAGMSCKRHYYSCVVNSQGFVQPCVGIDIYVGNIRYKPLKTILRESTIINNLRNMDKNIKGSCKECSLKMDCYGCRGMAYHIYGDYFEADPLCWNNPHRLRYV